jgi:hypothetical protein
MLLEPNKDYTKGNGITYTYCWDCPKCMGSNQVSEMAQLAKVKCGWCGHVVDAGRCRVTKAQL